MQILVHVLCTRGRSLRDAIAKDAAVEDYQLEVTREKQPGRAPGWMKLHSHGDAPGALNIEWDGATHSLSARIVTRTGQPSRVVGYFVNYLLARHAKRVQSITVAYR